MSADDRVVFKNVPFQFDFGSNMLFESQSLHF